MATTYIPLATQTLATAASSVTFSSIPQTYTDLVVVANLGKSLVGSSVEFRFNSDSGSNYSITELYGNGTSAASARVSSSTYGQVAYDVVPGSDITSNFVFNVMNYANTAVNKTTLSRNNSMATTYSGAAAIVGLWRSTAAINSITFTSSGGATFTTGSTFNLYGVASAALSAKATGGDTIKTDGTYWYHTFTASGTFTPTQSISCDYLVVAGGAGGGGNETVYGGGGWIGGGGGAGGYRTSIGGSALSLTATNYTVTIGAGGAAGVSQATTPTSGTSGSDSVFSTITSSGGGAGGAARGAGTGLTGTAGGSGGGGGSAYNTAGLGGAGNTPSTSPSQGNNGATASTSGVAGGGGGSSAVGTSGNSGGAGGAGTANSITGSSVTYAKGGSSGGGTAGVANTGNGGDSVTAGGSGLVIVRYAV